MTGFRGGLVRSIAQQGIAVLILLVGVTCASAQPATNREAAIDKLGYAQSSTDAATRFFEAATDDASKAPKVAAKNAFSRLREATQVLFDLAPKSFSDDLLSLTQIQLRAVNAKVPVTLSEAIDECEKDNNFLIAYLLAGDLSVRLAAAMEDLRAEAAFGKIANNLKLYEKIEPPRNGVDFLRNAAFALDHDVVLRRDFYSELNMRRLFGASYAPVYRKPNGEIAVRWTAWPRLSEMDKMKADEWKTKRCDYQVELAPMARGKRSGHLRVTCTFAAEFSPAISEVDSVFGKDREESRECPAHMPPSADVSAYCDRVVTYRFDKSTIHRELIFKFYPGGLFSSLALIERER